MESDPVNPEIQYEMFLDPSPSTAQGVFRGLKFMLDARYDVWEFAISPDANVDPSDIIFMSSYDLDFVQRGKQPFPEDWVRVLKVAFYRTGTYGKPGEYDASYMTKEERMRLVRECIAEFTALSATQ